MGSIEGAGREPAGGRGGQELPETIVHSFMIHGLELGLVLILPQRRDSCSSLAVKRGTYFTLEPDAEVRVAWLHKVVGYTETNAGRGRYCHLDVLVSLAPSW